MHDCEGASEGALGAIIDANLGKQVRRYRAQAHGGRLAILGDVQVRVGPGGANEQFLLPDSGAYDPTRLLVWGAHRSLDFMAGAAD